MIDKETKEELNEHSIRLYDIFYCFKLFLDCIEEKIHKDFRIEVLSFGYILQEYIKITKESYHKTGKKINVIK